MKAIKRSIFIILLFLASISLLILPETCRKDENDIVHRRKDNSPYCCDYAAFLGSDAEESMNIFFENFFKKKNMEFVSVVLPSIEEQDIVHVGAQIFDKWSIGDRNQGRGVLLVIAV